MKIALAIYLGIGLVAQLIYVVKTWRKQIGGSPAVTLVLVLLHLRDVLLWPLVLYYFYWLKRRKKEHAEDGIADSGRGS